MTNTQFNSECQERLIDPDLALENEKICAALRERNDDLVIQLLDNEF